MKSGYLPIGRDRTLLTLEGSRLGVAIDLNYNQSIDFENEKVNVTTSPFYSGVGANHNLELKAG